MQERPPSVPDHELLRSIGRGAYGDVWLARNLTGAYRAVKVVYRSRFENEKPFNREFEGIGKYEPVSRLHPSQLDILHVGESPNKDYFYYVMELADDARTGPVNSANVRPDDYVPKTLKSELSGGEPLPLAVCIDLGLSLTTALDNLHGHHLVHRDIKPSNIVYINGEPKLADIGLVTSLNANRSLVGTPGFFPPEGPGTPQADLYGLGKTLYEAAAGKDRQEFPESPNFSGMDSAEESYLEFHAILLKTCETAPRNRYATAQAMHADLALLKKGKSVRYLHWVERRLRFFKGVGLAAAILTVLAVGAIFYQLDVNRRTNRLSSELATSLYAAHMNLAAQAWYAGNLKTARDLVAKHQPQSASKDPIGFEWRLLWSLCHNTDENFEFRAHSGEVRSMAVSPDGRTVASVNDDGTVRILDLGRRSELASLEPHAERVNSVAFSEDGRFLATGGSDGRVRLVDTKDWRALETLGPLENEIMHLAISPDGRILAAGAGKTVVLWDLPSKECRVIEDDESIGELVFSPDGGELAVYGGLSTMVRFWNPVTGERVDSLGAHTAIILSIAFSANGRLLASSGHDNRVKVWLRKENGQGWIHRATFLHDALVRALAFSPDSRLLATGGGDNLMRIWDVNLEESTRTLRGHSAAVTSMSFVSDGSLVSASADGTVRLWDSPAGQEHNRLAQTGIIVNMSLSRNGKTLASSDPNHSTVHLWDVASQTRIHSFTGVSGLAANVAISPDGRVLAVHRKDHVLQLWSLPDYETPLLTLQGPRASIGHNVTFSPDGRYVVFPNSRDAVALWDVAANQQVGEFDLHHTELFGLAFSPDGDRLAGVAAGEVTIWNVETQSLIERVASVGRHIRSIAFSPDGRRLAFPTQETVIGVWDLEKSQAVAIFDGHTAYVDTVAFSPDGKTLASGSYDGTVKLWNLGIKQGVATLRGHLGPVTDLLFSSDGNTLYSASGDGTVKLWSAATFTEAWTDR